MLPSSTNWGTRRQWTSRLCPLLQLLVKTTHCRAERRPLPSPPPPSNSRVRVGARGPVICRRLRCLQVPLGRYWTAPGRSPSACCTCLCPWPASRGRRGAAPRGRWLGASHDCGLGGRLITPDNSGVWGEERSAEAIGGWLERGSAI